jgi:hypothetical protein
MNADTAITLALSLLDRAAAYGSLVTAARAEGRDVSDVELDALAAEDDAARKELENAIKKRRG